ncbi:MAG: 4-hydroxybenzoyl-CoA reductase subunit beta [Rhodospirillales bacterium]|nr:4-hydroxybenzoyl-CoA reductase subunit beta [Rhodospirillales bacterium]
MEVLPDFEILCPNSAEEAAQMASKKGESRYMAGGTDFMPNMRRGLEKPKAVIDLSGIGEMQSIEKTGNGLRIGASVTLQQLISADEIKSDFSLLAEAAETIAGTTHRQTATVGGNVCLDTRCQFYNQSEWWRKSNDYCLKYEGEICHVAPTGKICRAAFSGDLAPALMVHGAKVELTSAKGTRTIDLKDLYQEDGADYLLLEPGELLVAVLVEKLEGYKTAYRKVRVRGGVDFPLVGIAAAVKGNGTQLEDLRVGLTGTNSKPVSLEGTADLCGGSFDETGFKALEKLVQKQIQPMRSTFSPSHYRRKVALNVSRRLVGNLLEN